MNTPKQNQLIEEKGNGKGYLYYRPENSASIEDVAYSFSRHTEQRFIELSKIVGLAVTYNSVLLEGSPGAGKSNICHDIESSMISIGAPLLRISVHINAGTLRHAKETTDLLQRYRAHNNQGAARIFILDNADYGGYKGSSRTRTNAAQYAEQVIPELIDTVTDQNLIIIGAAHDEAWRESKWTWHDKSIDRPANELLEAFRARHEFKGLMREEAVHRLLIERGADSENASHITRTLGKAGLLSFFYVNHIDLDEFTRNEDQALEKVHHGRRERYGLR